MKRVNLVRLTILTLICVLLAGCWDYIEIETLEFVFGLGVDRVTPEYIVILEMVKTSGGGQQAQVEPKVLSTSSGSVSSGGAALSNVAGLRAFWPHAYVFLMSEQVAREGILDAVEYIARSRQVRGTVWVFVTKDCTVEEVFKSKPPVANSVSEHLNAISLMQENISGFIPLQVWELNQDLTKEGISPVLPTIRLVHERGELVPVVEGTAVLKGDRMVGWLDGHESDILCLLKGVFERGFFVINTEVGEHGRFPITYEIVGNQVDIKPLVKDGRPAAAIKLTMQFGVEEVGRAPINFRDMQQTDSVEAQLATHFKDRIRELLHKVQVEFNADVLGIGQLFRRKQPEAWRHFGSDWDVYFPDLPVELEVRCQVVLTGLSSAPLRVRD